MDFRKKTEKNLSLLKLNGYCPDNRLLNTGKYNSTVNKSFEDKKMIDEVNELRPYY